MTAVYGVIANGTQNVILYCLCEENNIAVGPSIWFINGTQVTHLEDDGSGDPYYRDNVPAPLIIPSFTISHVGTYRCASTSNSDEESNSVFLTLPGL